MGAAVVSINRVYAQEVQGKYPSIIQKLVQKFGLKEAEVKSVFDEAFKERQSQKQAKFEERLNQDVKDGKITEAQKKLILAKHQELQEKRGEKPENWQAMTPKQRREMMQTQKQELEKWVKENNLDPKYLFGGYERGMKGRFPGK